MIALGNLANAHAESDQIDKAIDVYSTLLKTLQKSNDPINEANCRGNLGAAYLAANKPEMGIKHLEQALEMAEHHADALGLSHALKHLCNGHATLNQASAVYDYAQRYLNVSRELHNTSEQEWAQSMLKQWKPEIKSNSSSKVPGSTPDHL